MSDRHGLLFPSCVVSVWRCRCCGVAHLPAGCSPTHCRSHVNILWRHSRIMNNLTWQHGRAPAPAAACPAAGGPGRPGRRPAPQPSPPSAAQSEAAPPQGLPAALTAAASCLPPCALPGQPASVWGWALASAQPLPPAWRHQDLVTWSRCGPLARQSRRGCRPRGSRAACAGAWAAMSLQAAIPADLHHRTGNPDVR